MRELVVERVDGPEDLPAGFLVMFGARRLEDVRAWAVKRGAARLVYYVVRYPAGEQFVGAVEPTVHHWRGGR